jgi:hypothetical protein
MILKSSVFFFGIGPQPPTSQTEEREEQGRKRREGERKRKRKREKEPVSPPCYRLGGRSLFVSRKEEEEWYSRIKLITTQ